MVVRLRIYASQQVAHEEADRVFYERVKPVHERHGARLLGRYRDPAGQVVVLWAYPDQAALTAIQAAVAEDPETLANRELRQTAGLHGLPFQEWILSPTAPESQT